MSDADWMRSVEFFARLTRKGGARTGQVIIANPAVRNGECKLAIAKNEGDRLPCVTWLHPRMNARIEPISAAEASALDPSLIEYVTKYQRSPEFRIGHTLEIRKPGRSSLQRANPREENDFPYQETQWFPG